jgi:hypothetical protein
VQQGYIRLYRCILDQGWHNKTDYVAVWVYILMRGNYRESEIMVDGRIVTLQPGQLLTSRKQMSTMTGVSESKIERILSLFKIEHQIEQQSFTKNRIITIVNWVKYQSAEHQIEQQTDSNRTANGQQPNTDKEGNKERRKERKKKPKAKTTRCALPPDGVSQSVWADFLQLRKVKRAPLTETALESIRKESAKAGFTLSEALAECCSRGWQGFKAEWVLKAPSAAPHSQAKTMEQLSPMDRYKQTPEEIAAILARRKADGLD